jgi:rhodanese-related sulfurtransferase
MAQLRHKKFLVLDVREPFESATSHLDEILMELLGNKTTRKIAQERKSHIDFDVVPLSRLPQFLIECIEKQTTLEILCVCRSGQRSLQAAELLRRLTLCKAYSLKGGLAALLAPEVSLAPRKTNPPPHAED